MSNVQEIGLSTHQRRFCVETFPAGSIEGDFDRAQDAVAYAVLLAEENNARLSIPRGLMQMFGITT